MKALVEVTDGGMRWQQETAGGICRLEVVCVEDLLLSVNKD